MIPTKSFAISPPVTGWVLRIIEVEMHSDSSPIFFFVSDRFHS